MAKRTIDIGDLDDARQALDRTDIPDAISILNNHLDLTPEQCQEINNRVVSLTLAIIHTLCETIC